SSLEDCPQSPAKDPQVQTQALVTEVEELVLQLLEGVEIARSVVVVDLCPARDAWTDKMAQVVEGDGLRQQFNVVRLLRPWAHDRQIVANDVPHLRELVDVKLPKHTTDLAEPRVVFCGPV